MRVVGIIPARYASTRFPGKPLARIGDRSMIEWVYRRAQQAFAQVAVATDDERIAEEVVRFGGVVVVTATSHTSGTDRCAEALRLLENRWGKCDVAVNIQGDEPFVEPAVLQRLAACFDDPTTEIATAMRPIAHPEEINNPNCVKVATSATGRALYFSRSPIPYIRGAEPTDWASHYNYHIHLGLYAYRADVLARLAQMKPSPLERAESLEQNRWLENDCCIRVIKADIASIGIDTPEDLEEARKLLDSRNL